MVATEKKKMKKSWTTHKIFVKAMSELTNDFDQNDPVACLALAQNLMPEAEFEHKDQNPLYYAFWFHKLPPAFIKGIYKK